jgi:hypothetical protein
VEETKERKEDKVLVTKREENKHWHIQSNFSYSNLQLYCNKLECLSLIDIQPIIYYLPEGPNLSLRVTFRLNYSNLLESVS